MKAKDIVVGEDYAVGSHSFPHRATVQSVGRSHGAWGRYTTSGICARVEYGSVRAGGTVALVALTEVLRPWADQEKLNAERRKADEAERAAYDEARAAAAAIKAHFPFGDVLAIGKADGRVEITITVEQARALRASWTT